MPPCHLTLCQTCHDDVSIELMQAKELGVRSIVLDGPDSWVQNLLRDKTIEQFVPIDFSEGELVFERCYKAIANIRRVRVSMSIMARELWHVHLQLNAPLLCLWAMSRASQ